MARLCFWVGGENREKLIQQWELDHFKDAWSLKDLAGLSGREAEKWLREYIASFMSFPTSDEESSLELSRAYQMLGVAWSYPNGVFKISRVK